MNISYFLKGSTFLLAYGWPPSQDAVIYGLIVASGVFAVCIVTFPVILPVVGITGGYFAKAVFCGLVSGLVAGYLHGNEKGNEGLEGKMPEKPKVENKQKINNLKKTAKTLNVYFEQQKFDSSKAVYFMCYLENDYNAFINKQDRIYGETNELFYDDFEKKYTKMVGKLHEDENNMIVTNIYRIPFPGNGVIENIERIIKKVTNFKTKIAKYDEIFKK